MAGEEERRDWASAIQRATWGCAPAIGRALGLSPRMVQQWGQADGDKRSPAERLEILIRVALEHRDRHDALAPLHLLADRLGYRLEPQAVESSQEPESRAVALRAMEAMIEASQAVHVAFLAQADGVISNDERSEVNRECDEAIQALIELKRVVARSR